MINDTSGVTLKAVPLSNNTVARSVSDTSNDLEDQLVEKLKGAHFAMQVDDATDSNRDCLLIAYLRFIISESLDEDVLFCRYVAKRATADKLFNIIDS